MECRSPKYWLLVFEMAFDLRSFEIEFKRHRIYTWIYTSVLFKAEYSDMDAVSTDACTYLSL